MSTNGATSETYPIVALLPVRNAEADLEGYFHSIAPVCDAVVALDDGSTDGTAAILEAHPLVKILLRNPVRLDYESWDDSANRNRLLRAAADLQPEWIVSVDADERFDERDAIDLRRFLQTDALPGCAYGMRHVPMWDDGRTFEPNYDWIYRIFSFEPDQRFSAARLHFAPIPTSIPPEFRVETTLRLQHLGEVSPERRLRRFLKYLEADPERRYEADYSHILRMPGPEERRVWLSRPAGMPVLRSEATQRLVLPSGADDAAPILSAIVIAQNNEATIARTMRTVVEQETTEPFEIVLVTSGNDRTAAIVREQFPSVRVVELPNPVLPGAARNAGLAVARGLYVSFPGSHVELPPGSLEARLRAHRQGYAMVTGVTLNGNETPWGWASYFLDQHESLPGLPSTELSDAPIHCSYARLPLIEVGGFPEDLRNGEDTSVNRALRGRGYVAWREASIQLVHRSPSRTGSHFLRHQFKRGRGWATLILRDRYRERPVLADRDAVLRLARMLPNRLHRIERQVRRVDPALAATFGEVRPLVILGALAGTLGMWCELLKPSPGKLSMLLDAPDKTVLVIENGLRPRIMLALVSLARREAAARSLPETLRGDALRDSELATRSQAGDVARLRDMARERLGIPSLDVVSLVPEACAAGDTHERSSTPFSGLAGALRGLRAGTVRSTLPWWQTASVVRTLRRAS
ncbi:MAG: glycosyltransferase [Thermomicrobiales bacterium]